MDGQNVLVAGMMLAVLVVLGKVIIPIAQAYARRLEGTGGAAQRSAEIAEIDARVRELEAREHRMAELEERLDFAERMIAQQRDPARLGAGDRP